MSQSSQTSAFVPGVSSDLFISYGHIDNRSSQWVEKLHIRLRDRLAELLGEDVTIWRDLKLNGADLLWETIRDEISRTAVFLSVLSPRYITSESCQKEAGCFVECIKRSGRSTIDGMARFIKVVKTPYDNEEPASIREFNTLAYRFYDEPDDQKNAFPVEYSADKDIDPAGYQKFYRESERLARTLADLLRALRQASQPTRAARDRQSVYVAFVTSDRAEQRQQLVNALRGKGCRVLPEQQNAPSTRTELDSILKETLPSCALAVHEMGRYYGAAPEGDSEQRSLVQLQYELVRQETKLRQKVWIPEDLTDLEPRQSQFLSSIETTGDQRCEFLKSAHWPFINGVLDELEKPEIHKTDQAKSIFLMFDKDDLDKPMRKSVLKHLISLGYPVFEPVFQGNGALIRKLETEKIRKAAATLIYYGAATDAWVQMKRMTVLKVLAGSEARAKHIRAVYLCAPEDEFKRNTYLEFSGKTLPEGGGLAPLLIFGTCNEQFAPDDLSLFLKSVEQELPC